MLGDGSVDQARVAEERALLLAAAGVGDQERDAFSRAMNGEVAQPRHAPQAVVEVVREPDAGRARRPSSSGR